MSIVAYTIGLEETYDQALRSGHPTVKTGRYRETRIKDANGRSPVYPGGVIYATAKEALMAAAKITETEARGAYAAYSVELAGWDDTYRNGDLQCLLVDRLVTGKIEQSQLDEAE